MTHVLAIPAVRGAIAGFVAAALVDVHSFLTWRTVKDFSSWDWRTALLRWTQGTVSGGLTGAGLGLTS